MSVFSLFRGHLMLFLALGCAQPGERKIAEPTSKNTVGKKTSKPKEKEEPQLSLAQQYSAKSSELRDYLATYQENNPITEQDPDQVKDVKKLVAHILQLDAQKFQELMHSETMSYLLRKIRASQGPAPGQASDKEAKENDEEKKKEEEPQEKVSRDSLYYLMGTGVLAFTGWTYLAFRSSDLRQDFFSSKITGDGLNAKGVLLAMGLSAALVATATTLFLHAYNPSPSLQTATGALAVTTGAISTAQAITWYHKAFSLPPGEPKGKFTNIFLAATVLLGLGAFQFYAGSQLLQLTEDPTTAFVAELGEKIGELGKLQVAIHGPYPDRGFIE